MPFSSPVRLCLGMVLALMAFSAFAQTPVGRLVTETERIFITFAFDDDVILASAKSLFWSLAIISLVWTMGMLIVRQDIAEMLMELLRFIIVTGTFYWLLINASDRDGGDAFVNRIVATFFNLREGNDTGEAFHVHADQILRLGMRIFSDTMLQNGDASDGDKLLAGSMAIIVLIVLTLLAAQFLLALVTAWMLGYAGIFLLGFGGARWTSQIAISYYKHVLAVGVMILVLGVIGAVGTDYLENVRLGDSGGMGTRSFSEFPYLGAIVAVSILMLVLAIRIPQFFYTLVTGSSLGLFAGAAGMIGSAIFTGGGAAIAAASGRYAGPGGGTAPGAAGTSRAESVMDAVQRSAVSGGGMGDPFHVGSGADPFGVPRRTDTLRSQRGGSVFGTRPTDLVGDNDIPAGVEGHASSPSAARAYTGSSTRADEQTASSVHAKRSSPIDRSDVEVDDSQPRTSRHGLPDDTPLAAVDRHDSRMPTVPIPVSASASAARDAVASDAATAKAASAADAMASADETGIILPFAVGDAPGHLSPAGRRHATVADTSQPPETTTLHDEGGPA